MLPGCSLEIDCSGGGNQGIEVDPRLIPAYNYHLTVWLALDC